MQHYYAFTVPFFKKNLENLSALLTKAEAYMLVNHVPESELLQAALTTDMFPLVKQVQIATDNAKGACARLAGVEVPSMEDSETTIAALHARIQKTITFLDTLTEDQFEGAHDRVVTMKYFPGMHFIGHDYLIEYAIPNFLFHVSTAYAILRMRGVEIGKADFLGKLTLHADEVA